MHQSPTKPKKFLLPRSTCEVLDRSLPVPSMENSSPQSQSQSQSHSSNLGRLRPRSAAVALITSEEGHCSDRDLQLDTCKVQL